MSEIFSGGEVEVYSDEEMERGRFGRTGRHTVSRGRRGYSRSENILRKLKNIKYFDCSGTAGPVVSLLPCSTTTPPRCRPTPRPATRSFPSERARYCSHWSSSYITALSLVVSLSVMKYFASSSRSSERRTQTASTGASAAGGRATFPATWSPRSRWTTRESPGSS